MRKGDLHWIWYIYKSVEIRWTNTNELFSGTIRVWVKVVQETKPAEKIPIWGKIHETKA